MRKNDFVPDENQMAIRRAYEKYPNKDIFVVATAGCLAPDTMVKMHDGRDKMAMYVGVGDELMGPDGGPRLVLSTASGEDDMYRVIPKTGKPFICNSSHILTLYSHHTGKISDFPISKFIDAPHKKLMYSIVRPEGGINYETKDVPVDPYLVGLWYAGGAQFDMSDTICFTIDSHSHNVLEYLRHGTELGEPIMESVVSGTKRLKRGFIPDVKLYFADTSPNGNSSSGAIIQYLINYNKRNLYQIPHEYLHNDRANRLKLLAGIMDALRFWPNQENVRFQCRRENVTHVLNQLYDLVFGLGYEMWETTYNVNKKWSVIITTPVDKIGEIPHLSEHVGQLRAPKRPMTKRKCHRTHFDIEPIGQGKWYGFSVNKDHRFLLSDYTITHNSGKTTTSCWLLNESSNRNVLFLAFNTDIADELGRRLPKYIITSTFHSWGYRTLKSHFPKIVIKKNMVFEECMKRMKRWGVHQYGQNEMIKTAMYVKKYVDFWRLGMCKNKHEFKRFVATQNMLPETDHTKFTEEIITWMGNYYKKALEVKSTIFIDFTSMLWAPVFLNLPFRKFREVFVDECFPGNQHVLMEGNVTMKIKDIHEAVQKGKKLNAISYNEKTKTFEPKPVTNSWGRGRKRLMTVVVDGAGEIKCTPKHKLLTLRGWIMAKHLVPGTDKLISYGFDDATIYSWRLTFPEDVYDIEVADNHNFVVVPSESEPKGFVAHNCQDSSKLMWEIIDRSCSIRGRKFAVGDESQSIYSFTGASPEIFLSRANNESAIKLGLPVSRRCSKAICTHAKSFCSNKIEAHPSNPQGFVGEGNFMDAEYEDYILCRNNKPLFVAFYSLIAQGKKCFINDDSLSQDLLRYLQDFEREDSMDVLKHRMLSDIKKAKNKLLKRGMKNVDNHPKIAKLAELFDIISFMMGKFDSPASIYKEIDNIFNKNDKRGIQLMTYHKSKGLEATSVYLIAPGLCPSNRANTKEMALAEKNLQFVAITRAKNNLYYDFDSIVDEKNMQKSWYTNNEIMLKKTLNKDFGTKFG